MAYLTFLLSNRIWFQNEDVIVDEFEISGYQSQFDSGLEQSGNEMGVLN